MIPPVVPPLPDGFAPDPSPSPLGTRSFHIRALLGFVLIFAFLLYQNVIVQDTKARAEKNDRAKIYVDALTATKLAYSQRDYELRWSGTGTKRAKWSGERASDAIKQWKQLAESPRASASDWRRLGIVQYAFGYPADGKKSLSKASELGTKPRPKKDRDDFETEPYPEVTTDPKYEYENWELIYGKRPITSLDASKLRQLITTNYQLGWFEHLVAEQTYRKTGRTLDAAAEKAAALSSCTRINLVDWTRMMLVFWGFAAWIWYGIKALVKSNRRKNLRSDTMDMPVLPILPNRFSYPARITAFLTYFVLPIAAIIPYAVLHGLLVHASALTLVRVRMIAYLVFAFGSAGMALWVLSRLSRRATEQSSEQSDSTVLQRLGLWSRNPVGSVFQGAQGYALALMPMLIAAGISYALFHRFKTPSHPIVYELLVMQTASDRFLMFLQTAVVAAITEEIMFRGVLYPAFRERFGVTRGILLTSALFALAHPTLPGGFLPLMALGAAFNVAYEKTGSLLPGITMHALNNGLLVLAEFAVLAS